MIRLSRSNVRGRIAFFACAAYLASCAAARQSANADDSAAPGYAESADESPQYAVETVLSKLDNPCGLAVRFATISEGPWELAIAESGAGKILLWPTDGEASAVRTAVDGLPVREFGAGPPLNVGPLGLVFLTRSKLAVGGAGLEPGKELVQVFALPDDKSVLKGDQADHSVGPLPATNGAESGPGTFYSLAKTEGSLFVPSRGDDSKGWVLKASIAANRLADLQPFIAATQLTGAATPTALAINPKPTANYLVVGLSGAAGPERDSVLAFFSPLGGKLALALPVGLHDVTGLAYSPSGDLYAADFSWAAPEDGGVFRIDAAEVDGREGCRAVRIAAVTRPAALAFTPDGVLYVTAVGDRTDPGQAPTGALLKIVPGPTTPKL